MSPARRCPLRLPFLTTLTLRVTLAACCSLGCSTSADKGHGPTGADGGPSADSDSPFDGGSTSDGGSAYDADADSSRADASPGADTGTDAERDSSSTVPSHKGINATGGAWLVLNNQTPTQLAATVADFKALGVQWVRFEFDWSIIQPTGPTTFDFTSTDAVVSALTQAGIGVLGLLDYSPGWANGGQSTKTYRPTNNSDFASFAGAVAKRYAPMGVHVWEVWNEPNLQHFWGPPPSASDYAGLLEAAYPAIHGADGSAVVVSAGLSQPGDSASTIDAREFLTGMYAAGVHGSLDAVGDHPYCTPPAPCDNIHKIYDSSFGSTFLSIMAANGDGSKQVWITEWGCFTAGTTDGTPCSESVQASAVTELYSFLDTAAWAGPAIWYNYQDFCSSGSSDSECYFGLIRYDGSQKPAYASYQAAPR